MLTQDEVIKIAELARIELRPDEIEKFQKNLDTILAYVEDLKQVNTEGLDIVASVTGLENVQRDDAPVMAEQELIVNIEANAPEIKDGYYKVKSIL